MLDSEAKVLAGEEGIGSFRIGTLELNSAKNLNALDAPMLNKIEKKLLAFEKREDIAAIVLYSKSEKAFCAGGDVKALVLKSRTSNLKENTREIANEFFTQEYFVDHLIHKLKKPTICIADGVTMGGGVGLMNGCKFRIVTERTWMAMPEVSIGLFPDVGSGYFLNQVPNSFGYFLGLTGARFKAGDALRWKLADVFIESSNLRKMWVDLMRLSWTDSPEKNHLLLKNLFAEVSKPELAPSDWIEIESKLLGKLKSKTTTIITLEEFDAWIQNSDLDHSGFQQAKKFYQSGSAISKRLIYEGLKRMESMKLRDVFELEWNMAIEASISHDFSEGVRALLIDKDQNPNWSEAGIPSNESVEKYFKPHEPQLLKQRFDEFLY